MAWNGCECRKNTKKAKPRSLHCVASIWDINGKGKRHLISCFWGISALHLPLLGKGHSALFLKITTLLRPAQCIIGLFLALICIIKKTLRNKKGKWTKCSFLFFFFLPAFVFTRKSWKDLTFPARLILARTQDKFNVMAFCIGWNYNICLQYISK